MLGVSQEATPFSQIGLDDFASNGFDTREAGFRILAFPFAALVLRSIPKADLLDIQSAEDLPHAKP